MIKVFMVSPRYLPILGGAEVQCSRLVKELKNSQAKDIKVERLITRKIAKNLPRKEEIEGLEIVRFGLSGIGLFKEYLFCFHLLLYLFFNRNNFDVLHCHATGIFGITCSIFSRFFGKKVLLKISTNGELKSLNESKLKSNLADFLLKHSTLVALNEEGASEAKETFPNVRCVIIPNGISVKENVKESQLGAKVRADIKNKFGDDAIIGVFIGRFVERKGIKLINKLASIGILEKLNIVLLLVGDSSNQRDSCEVDTSHSHLLPQGLQYDVYPYLEAADFFFSPSFYEGLPNTVLEALSVRKYCVLSNIKPHMELRNDNEAMIELFELSSQDSVVSCLEKIVDMELPKYTINPKYDISTTAILYKNEYLRELSFSK